MPPTVFLAHCSDDKDTLATPLAALLKDAGREVWIDAEKLEEGADLTRSLWTAIHDSDPFALLLTPNVVTRQGAVHFTVVDEWKYAFWLRRWGLRPPSWKRVVLVGTTVRELAVQLSPQYHYLLVYMAEHRDIVPDETADASGTDVLETIRDRILTAQPPNPANIEAQADPVPDPIVEACRHLETTGDWLDEALLLVSTGPASLLCDLLQSRSDLGRDLLLVLYLFVNDPFSLSTATEHLEPTRALSLLLGSATSDHFMLLEYLTQARSSA